MIYAIGPAGREVLRHLWIGRGKATFAGSYLAIVLELQVLGLVFFIGTMDEGKTTLEVHATNLGRVEAERAAAMRWVELWTEVANRLVSEVLVVQVREGHEAATRMGRRAQRARQRAREAFSRAYGGRRAQA